jgi:undecaprenyl-diphosphatase
VISLLQAIIIGLVQGVAELFPVSSLGHSVIIPQLFGWNIHQNDPYFLTFLVATHLATALVLFGFFWKDWVKVIQGLWRSIVARKVEASDTYAKLGWLLIIGTLPAAVIGLALEHSLRQLFASAQIASFFLIINGCILLLAEKLRRNAKRKEAARPDDKQVAKLGWRMALGIGTAQAGALIPGISRSGASMSAGLLAGLNNEDAARFSFLLATPIIGAAAILKLPELFQPSAASIRGAILAGSICAGITAYFSVRFLLKYFQTKTLTPFAVYCLIAGVALSVYFLVR